MILDLDELNHWLTYGKIEPTEEIQINNYQTDTVDLIRDANLE